MADKFVTNVTDKFRIAADDRQWIIQRRNGTNKDGSERWDALTFVGSTRNHLAYRLMGHGCPREAITHALTTFPGTFAEWRSMQAEA